MEVLSRVTSHRDFLQEGNSHELQDGPGLHIAYYGKGGPTVAPLESDPSAIRKQIGGPCAGYYKRGFYGP